MKFDALGWLLRQFWGLKHHFKYLLQSWYGKYILIRFTSTWIEIGVYVKYYIPKQQYVAVVQVVCSLLHVTFHWSYLSLCMYIAKPLL